MNIIFLDIDGVLNSARSVLAYSYRLKAAQEDVMGAFETKSTIDEVSVGLLNRVLIDCNAHIVLSSSHRSHFEENDSKTQKIQEYLSYLGVLGERCIGYTPGSGGFRGAQIAQWLESYGEHFGIKKFVILDDSSDFAEEQKPFHVHCKGGSGISEQNFFEMLRLFGVTYAPL